MTKPVLSYFDLAASRGEECRLAFVLAGVDFTDDRIGRADWPTRKSQMPFARVPVLTIAGKAPLGESNAILRYIARSHELEPKDAWEQALHDAMMEACEDIRGKIGTALRLGTTDEDKKQARLELERGVLRDWACAIEAQIQGPFAFGTRPTVVDLKLFMLHQWLTGGIIDHMPASVLDDYPKLVALCSGVGSIPEIKAFRDKHRKS